MIAGKLVIFSVLCVFWEFLFCLMTVRGFLFVLSWEGSDEFDIELKFYDWMSVCDLFFGIMGGWY